MALSWAASRHNITLSSKISLLIRINSILISCGQGRVRLCDTLSRAEAAEECEGTCGNGTRGQLVVGLAYVVSRGRVQLERGDLTRCLQDRFKPLTLTSHECQA